MPPKRRAATQKKSLAEALESEPENLPSSPAPPVPAGKKRAPAKAASKSAAKPTAAAAAAAAKPIKGPNRLNSNNLSKESTEDDIEASDAEGNSDPDDVFGPPKAKPTATATAAALKRKRAAADTEESAANKAPAKKAKKGAATEPQQEEQDEQDEEEDEITAPAPPPKKRGAVKAPAPAKKPAAKKQTAAQARAAEAAAIREREDKEDQEAEEAEEEVAAPKKPVKAVKKAAAPKKTAKVVEIAETQMVFGDEEEEDELEIAETQQVPVAANKGRKNDDEDKKAKRFAEALEEMRTNAAEQALEEFKKSSKEVMDKSAALIASLRAELLAANTAASETKAIRKKLAAKDSEITTLKTRIVTLESTKSDLTKQLSTLKSENAVLQTKLTVAQAQAQKANISHSSYGSSQPPGSAVKPTVNGRGVIAPPGGAPAAGWEMKAKEDLYADLTNLIINNVRKEEWGCTYTCIQTGVNGSFSFKLSMRDPSNSTRRPKAPSASQPSPEEDKDEDFIFIPMEAQQDQYVMSVLPDYLHGEISFTRAHAFGFFRNISTALNKKFVAEEEESEEEDVETQAGDMTRATEYTEGEEQDDTMVTAEEID